MRNKISNCSNIGKLMILIGLIILFPIIVLPFYKTEITYMKCFLIPSAISIFLGFIFCLVKKEERQTSNWYTTMADGSLTVLFAWGYGFFLGAMPFFLWGELSFVQSLFEAVSGFTTTGLSVLDVSKTPQIFLFHRAFMQFCGGLGFVMLMTIFIHGKQSMNLYNAEGHPDKLMPNLQKTSQIICLMYISFLSIGTVFYMLFGMNLFDGVTHAMCALSTGGFSSKIGSIGDYHSIGIEAVTVILMIIGTTNFAVLLLIAKGRIRQALNVSEMKFFSVMILIFVPIAAVSLFYGIYTSLGESIRLSIFNVVSALSTSGFSTCSYESWNPASLGIMILLMIVGGGIGSTAGGIKLSRVYLILRMTAINVKKRFFPSRHISIDYYTKPQGKAEINDSLIMDTIGFVISYILIFIIGSLVLTVTAKCDLTSAMFDFASSLGTVGLSIGITGPNTNNATLIVEMIGMLMGRLEIFIVLIGLYSGILKITCGFKALFSKKIK